MDRIQVRDGPSLPRGGPAQTEQGLLPYKHVCTTRTPRASQEATPTYTNVPLPRHSRRCWLQQHQAMSDMSETESPASS